MTTPCPHQDQFKDIASGLADEDLTDKVFRHVEGCPSCAELLDRELRKGDSLIGSRLRDDQDTETSPTSPNDPSIPLAFHLLDTRTSRVAPQQTAPIPTSLPAIPGYEILSLLGRGGMGIVYKARQISLNRVVALKMLHGPYLDSNRFMRFRREAEAVARLQHPNIVQIFEVNVQPNSSNYETPYLCLEYVPGGTLAWRLGRRPHPPVESARLIETLARAIDLAHRQGIIHRDLKPSNILLSSSPGLPDDQFLPLSQYIPKISDFGLARLLNDNTGSFTHTGDQLGTPEYMSPEQAAGKSNVGPTADVYALGVILYECLTGRPPFQHQSVWSLLELVLTDDPVPPTRHQTGIHRDLETITLRCLNKDPARRYTTARDLADDLQAFLEGRPIRARRVGELERAWMWAQRRPAITALLAAVFLTITVALGLVSWQWRRAESEWQRAEDKAQAEGTAKADAEKARREAESQQSQLALAQGLSLCEAGEIDQGLLLLVRGLELAHRAGAGNLERPLRVNLGDWSRQLPRLQRQWRHPGGCNQLAFSPDGKLIATAGRDSRVRFWNFASGKEDGQPLWPYFPPTKLHVWDVAFSPDGKTLATGGSDGKAILWDVATRRRLRTLVVSPDHGHSNVWCTAFSLDGKLIATGGPDEKVRLWQTATGKLTRTLEHPKSARIRSVAFNPNGKIVYSGAFDGHLRSWDLNSSALVGSSLVQGSIVQVIKCSPDGKWGLTGGYEGGLHLWNTENLQVYQLPYQSVPIYGVAFSPDGRIFATSAGGVVRLWDTWSRRPLGPVIRQDALVASLGFSPDGRTLAVAENAGSVRLITVTNLNSQLPVATLERPHSVQFDRAGRRLLIAGRDQWSIHDATHKDLPVKIGPVLTAREIVHEVKNAVLCPDGNTLATSTFEAAVVWDIAARKPHARTGEHQGSVKELAFTADGSMLLTYCNNTYNPLAGWKHRGGFWDVKTGKLVRPLGALPSAEVNQLALSNDSRLVLLGCSDRTARLLDLQKNKPWAEPLPHASSVMTVAFRADGRQFLTGCRDGTLHLWDTQTLNPVGEVMRHSREITACAFSPDGTLILAADMDGAARFWDPVSGQRLGSPIRHAGAILSLAFHPEGRYIVTAGQDGTVRQWQVPPHEVMDTPEVVRKRIENLIDGGVIK